jgi:co-chaperonin GroES (HSP10)
MKIKKMKEQLVLVRVMPAEEQDESGIYIQEEWQTQIAVGTVEVIGEDVKFCEVGDVIWFERYSSPPEPFNPSELRGCREDMIMAVYEK